MPVVKTFELETATLADVQEAMRLGELSSVELALLYLNRIAAYDRTSGPIGLNTVPVLNPDVIPEAARADRLRRQGIDLGPLHGIPFTAKGNYNVEGLLTTNGLTVWADFTAPYTCHVVEALQEKAPFSSATTTWTPSNPQPAPPTPRVSVWRETPTTATSPRADRAAVPVLPSGPI